MKLKEEPGLVVNGVALLIALLMYVALVASLRYAEGLTSWADRFNAAAAILPILFCLAVVEVIAYLIALFLNIRDDRYG